MSSSKNQHGLKVIVAHQAVLPDQAVLQQATVVIECSTGQILDVLPKVVLSKTNFDSSKYGNKDVVEWIELPEEKVLMPGLVDAHVHLNQPGRTSWEGFSSGTLAAISGGVTTVIDMPLNSIPSTTSVGALEVKIKAARYGWENWKSLEEAKRLPQIQNGDQTRFRSGTGIGPGWDETSIEENDDGDSDQELALMNGQDSSEFKKIQRTGVTGSRRLLDILGPADVSAEGSRGVYCDVGFWGGIIPGNKAHLQPLLKAGVKGFKCFLMDSGVDEFPAVSEEDVRQAMTTLKGTGGLILFHAEIGDPVQGLGQDQSYQTFLRSRPDQWEVTAIESIIRLLQEQAASEEAAKATRAHIVHLATAQALPMIAKARSDGLPLTTETCFHYLVLSSDAVPAESDKHHTEYKCCPPIREESNRELLWQALETGLIDYVVSDHSPCTPDLKQGGFMDAWGGISALGLGVSLLWTEICKRNALREKQRLEGPLRTLSDLVRWCCVNTAEQVGLKGRKGTITKGADADLIVFDPNARFTVGLEELKFKNKLSPYLGLELQGKVDRTYLRGSVVYDINQGGEVGNRIGNLI